MKKFISILLLIAIFVSSVPAFAADEQGFPEFAEQKSIGRGSWSAETHNGTICYDREGNPLMCYSTQGGFFWVIDLLTGKVRQQFTLIGDYIFAHLVTTAPNGKVYIWFYPANCFNVYDPIAGTLEAIAVDTPFTAQDGGCITEDEMIYLGEYNEEGARVFSYDIKTGAERIYTLSDTKCTYVKGITYDDKYIYAGTGVGAENAKMFRLDKETGEETIFLQSPGGGIIYCAYMINGKIIAHSNGQFHIVDPKTLKKENGIRTGHSRQGEIYPSPYNEKEFYHFYADALWKYNTETQENIRMVDCLLDNTLDWAELPNGDWVLALRTNTMEKVGYYNPKTNEVTVFKLDKIADAGPNVQSIEIDDLGLAYCGGYQSSMGVYNTRTEEFVFSMPKWHQNEGVGILNGKAYFGVYSGAFVYRYDPEKPLTDHYLHYKNDDKYDGYDANPSMLWDMADGQDRQFVVKGYNNKVHFGTFSDYNQSGGAYAIMSEEDGVSRPERELYRNVVPGQSLTGLAFKGNLAYIGSTVRNGKGAYEYPEGYAEIVVFDMDKKEVIDRFTPNFPIVGTNVKTIGELSFGPDGLLYGAVAEQMGLVFAMDPETHEIVKYVAVNPAFQREPLARPIYLRWGDDGMLYTTAGWNVYVINPETMDFKQLAINCSLMTLDPDGNVWYAKGSSVFNRKINQYDRLQGFLRQLDIYVKKDNYTEAEWTALQAEIDKARKYTTETDWKEIQDTIRIIKGLRDKKPYVKPTNDINIVFDGKDLEYDYDTTGTIKLYNGTTYVPYRAFLEMLGYKVKWNVHTATITASKDDSEIVMVVHNNEYTINGEQITSDIRPLTLSGTQYIPVRLISEKLGYEVKWNEDENKVYIDKK